MKPIVYTHTFPTGVYFGNAIADYRPFSKKNRNKLWMELFAVHGFPIVSVIECATVEEADLLEQVLFDNYIQKGGTKLQTRPSGKDLQNSIARNKKVIYPEKKAKVRKPRTNLFQDPIRGPIARSKISETMKGRTQEVDHTNKIVAKNNEKWISRFDGRITTWSRISQWNNKNPNYIDTWVLLRQ
jgi:hypothetical protein